MKASVKIDSIIVGYWSGLRRVGHITGVHLNSDILSTSLFFFWLLQFEVFEFAHVNDWIRNCIQCTDKNGSYVNMMFDDVI